MIFSIDQNCHSLWDAVPKCQALAAAGLPLRHFVEDTDIAFTALGSHGQGGQLRLARERFHHSGGADWGAAMFYYQFLGRLPVDVRRWEGLTGMKTAALARGLDRTVEDLYEEFSPADNWQLVGPSYVGDRHHHRLIADITVAEAGGFLRELMHKARADMLERFPAKAARDRTAEWFAAEERRVEQLLAEHTGGKLVELYRTWMGQLLGGKAELAMASSLSALSANSAGVALLEMFCQHYEQASALYNESLRQSDASPGPLETAEGELPFFAALDYQGHLVRTNMYLRDGSVRIADDSFALDSGRVDVAKLKAAGVWGLAGKAVVLAIQVRWGDRGAELALPYRGSAYVPAAQHLAGQLSRQGLLVGEVRPLLRVRFHMLDRMRQLDTVIRLPEHLAKEFGTDEVPARRLAEGCGELARQAGERLEQFKSVSGRRQWQRDNYPTLLGEVERLDARRRELAAREPKSPAIRQVWKQLKVLQADLLAQTLGRIALDWQMRDIEYWDSRGAIWPWCIALGGEKFYNHVIAKAEIYREPPPLGDE